MSVHTRRRGLWVFALLLAAGLLAYLVYASFASEYALYITPGALHAQADYVEDGDRVAVGGIVVADSLETAADGLRHSFRLSDGIGEVRVTYRGVLPSMFATETGALVRGTYRSHGGLQAESVLVMHDETYRPMQAP